MDRPAAGPGDVQPPYARLEGPNQWLDEATLPGFRALVERFQREMGRVANELMAAMSLGLGLPRTTSTACSASGVHRWSS